MCWHNFLRLSSHLFVRCRTKRPESCGAWWTVGTNCCKWSPQNGIACALPPNGYGMWVLDEAHCLSRWGHDFRPDYRYVGRFIREKAGEGAVPPVVCLTATAKPDVRDEIADYFREYLGIELRVFDGGARRDNLDFVVVETTEAQKFAHVHQVLESDLPDDGSGGAIVYCATRRRTEELADFLRQTGMSADHFHGGLTPELKKVAQEGFIRGELRVIVATNAFGMGIDKPDVRLVVHADIPGPLENYLQEAGRAGRDQRQARCVLLYTAEDVERQFGLSARSRLNRREIHGVLRALRNLDRKAVKHDRNRADGEVVATGGEILLEDDRGSFQRDEATDDTRVRTAVSWLEEAVLLSREENRVQIFPSSLRVSSIKEARARLERADINETYRARLLGIAEVLIEADPDEGVSTDELMSASGLSPDGIRGAMYDLERLGIASNDTPLTAYVHTAVERSSHRRFEEAQELETALIELLQETSPDVGAGESSMLHLRRAAQRLRDAGHNYALPERLARIVRSIAADGRGEGSGGGSLAVRGQDSETMWVTVLRDWSTIRKIAEQRRSASFRLLEHLAAALPQQARGTDLLAETTLGKLLEALRSDMLLMAEVRAPEKLLDRALLWLHEQEVLRLNKGLVVLRPAMTIRLSSERRGFSNADFGSLQVHYDEQVRQMHVMAEYAQKGLESMADALAMALDYFSLGEEEFLGRWLPERSAEISRQTTPESWRRIVDSLNNPIQRRIVADTREQTNVLVLAEPGSGKTRVLVQRIAFLIRARRENPRGIIALAYNRHAAVEIRRRLFELIGDDARGVTVMTCHALAMRLVGVSFTGRADRLDERDFPEILRRATALLRGDDVEPEDADEYRARLLAGYRWILVDEYQDIAAEQHDLISALAGRTLTEDDARLSLFAVGDDDQNIYTFNGASVEFMRRFEADYDARPMYLNGNYRSTAHIIAASNALIGPARERMKRDHPIEVNRARRREPDGGRWASVDPVRRGKVQVLPLGRNPISQAQAVICELKRLAALDPDWKWESCAVMAREWRFLDPVRSLCIQEGIPVQMANEEFTGVWRLRETQALLDWLRSRDSKLVSSGDVVAWLGHQKAGPWVDLLKEGVEEYDLETAGVETSTEHYVEWLAEWSRDVRRRQQGLMLLTAHRAKGLEFKHVVVLDGGWGRVGRGEDVDAPRRLYYVAMTRAQETLTLVRMDGPHPLLDGLADLSPVVVRERMERSPESAPGLARRYGRLSLSDVFLSYAGYREAGHPVHRAIAELAPGDRLKVRDGRNRLQIVNQKDVVVGELSQGVKVPGGMKCDHATVLAVATWDGDGDDPGYRERLRSDRWEVVVPELVLVPDVSPGAV